MPKFQGAIFDVDGVLVDSPHEKAWRESLRELMESSWRDIRGQTTWSPEAFTPHVYQQYVSGKPRMSGARAALDYFQVPDADKRAVEYADHKQAMVVRLIEAGDFHAYPDALRFVIATKDAGMRIADASSSKNAGLFLRQIRLDTFAQENGISSPTIRPGLTLLDYFDADVSGRDFAHGKPDPEIFLTAAHELGVEPRRAFVVEDASAGVQAAKAGDMAAIGIARADDANLLAAADADLVVTTLDDVDTTALADGRLTTQKDLARTLITKRGQPPGSAHVPAQRGRWRRVRVPGAAANDIDAPSMSREQHRCSIDVVCPGPAGRTSVTRAPPAACGPAPPTPILPATMVDRQCGSSRLLTGSARPRHCSNEDDLTSVIAIPSCRRPGNFCSTAAGARSPSPRPAGRSRPSAARSRPPPGTHRRSLPRPRPA
jgi:beta-phosphoglucomutase